MNFSKRASLRSRALLSKPLSAAKARVTEAQVKVTHSTGQKGFAKISPRRRALGAKWRSLAKRSSAEVTLRQQPALSNLRQRNGERARAQVAAAALAQGASEPARSASRRDARKRAFLGKAWAKRASLFAERALR